MIAISYYDILITDQVLLNLYLQNVIRSLREAGAITGPQYDCGTHIHIDAADYTPQQIRNLVNLWSSKENYLWDALQVSSDRSRYCKKINRTFVEKLNKSKPITMDKIEDLWYEESSSSRSAHYNPTRYSKFHCIITLNVFKAFFLILISLDCINIESDRFEKILKFLYCICWEVVYNICCEITMFVSIAISFKSIDKG